MRQEIEITEENRTLIFAGKICPYCGKETKFVDSKIVYNGKSYGMIYYCAPCAAWVGTHKGNPKALGRLADDKLRTMKKDAHAWFDPIWQYKVGEGQSKFEARTSTYKWLSEELGIDRDLTHIGYFNVEQCQQVIDACRNYYKQFKTVK